jgi:hypothetical protein
MSLNPVYINGIAQGRGRLENTTMGVDALHDNVTGEKNSSLGFQTLVDITDQKYNTVLGFRSGNKLTGDYNTYLGGCSGYVTSGQYNIGVGFGVWSSTGNYNITIGTAPPSYPTNSIQDSPSGDLFDEHVDEPTSYSFSGSYNITIGTGSSITGSNSIVIGNGLSTSSNYQTILGNYETLETKIPSGYTILNTDNYSGVNSPLDTVKLRVHGQVETDTTLKKGLRLLSAYNAGVRYFVKCDPTTHVAAGTAYHHMNIGTVQSPVYVSVSSTFTCDINPASHTATVSNLPFLYVEVSAAGVFTWTASVTFDVSVSGTTHQSTNYPTVVSATAPSIGATSTSQKVLGTFKMKVDGLTVNCLEFYDMDPNL